MAANGLPTGQDAARLAQDAALYRDYRRR